MSAESGNNINKMSLVSMQQKETLMLGANIEVSLTLLDPTAQNRLRGHQHGDEKLRVRVRGHLFQ